MASGVSNKDQKDYIRLYCSAGYTQGKPYIVDDDGTLLSPVALAAPGALAVYQTVAVPQSATTTVPGWYTFQVKGNCVALIDGTSDIAANSWIKLAASGVAFVLDHATDRSTASAGTVAVAVTANSAALTACRLNGERVIIA